MPLVTNYKQTNVLYINVASVYGNLYNETGNVIDWATPPSGALSTALNTAGSVVFRDMGKTIYLPSPMTGTSQSTILRKIQLIPNGTLGTGGAAPEFYTGYIRIGGQTYGGGDGAPTAVARIG